MIQKNSSTGKERQIRPPQGLTAPSEPLVPQGPFIVVCVAEGQPGKMIEIDEPNNPGKKVQVNVPKMAPVGQKMAVPVPKKGESIDKVQEREELHLRFHKG